MTAVAWKCEKCGGMAIRNDGKELISQWRTCKCQEPSDPVFTESDADKRWREMWKK